MGYANATVILILNSLLGSKLIVPEKGEVAEQGIKAIQQKVCINTEQ
jgi:hypothetical protein